LSAELGRGPATMSQEALRRLMAHDWPGNVRQLENAVERALAFSQGRPQIEIQDLTLDVQAAPAPSAVAATSFPEDGFDFDHYMSNVELTLIKQSLELTQANKRRAAALLVLKRTTLV
jgi:DNA-binding NtrC family response regulator